MTLQTLSQPLDNWLALFVPLVIWAVLLLFVLALFLSIQDGIQRLRRLHQIPCHRCQYYTGSNYLKCPVHPVSAFSEDAIHCRDYDPKPQHPRPIKHKPLKI
ncbi:MAG: hypothetical protein AAF215_27485 [Cyanobacteria bacterium P01_A01_bin.123]